MRASVVVSTLMSFAACAPVQRAPLSPALGKALNAATATETPRAVDIAKARAAGEPQLFSWAPFSKETFDRARAEHRFILLHGAAVWCHWCHVMEAVTYRDPAVGRLIRDRFIAIRVDIDAEPDIGERYGDWGWPATILFSPEAEEVGKFRGYLRSGELIEALENVTSTRVQAGSLDDAEPGASSAPVAALPWLLRRGTLDLDAYYDVTQGGWGMRQKAPLGFDAQLELARGAAGEPEAWSRAIFSLNQQARLIDPVWGGIYQYSVGGDWTQPHFEKLMTFQAANLQAYADGFRLSHQPAFRADADGIANYVLRFLTAPSGAFYVSQDADVGAHDEHTAFIDGHAYYAKNEAERLALGVPDVDQHVYAAENGLMISALCGLFEATHDDSALRAARRAADVVLASHLEASGGLVHDAESTNKTHFLADGAAFGLGTLRLFHATHEAKYLTAALSIAQGLEPLFDPAVGAYLGHDPNPDAAGVFASRRHPFEYNVRMARFLSALSLAAPEPRFAARARQVLAAISTPAALDTQGRLLGEYLLALRESSEGPTTAKKDLPAGASYEQSAAGPNR